MSRCSVSGGLGGAAGSKRDTPYRDDHRRTAPPRLPLRLTSGDRTPQSRRMRTILIICSALAVAACTSSCGAAPVVERQTPAAVTCLPTAVSTVLACSSRGDHACVIAALATLVVCWATHQPPAVSPPPSDGGAGSAVSDSGDASHRRSALVLAALAAPVIPEPAPSDGGYLALGEPVWRCAAEPQLDRSTRALVLRIHAHPLLTPDIVDLMSWKVSPASLVPQAAPRRKTPDSDSISTLRL